MDKKTHLINAAYELFASKGYANVGMREICKKAKLEPVQAYRLDLGKEDLLAESSIILTKRQLETIAHTFIFSENDSLEVVVLRYLEKLYEFDIDNILIRSQSAPYGWLWNRRYEAAVISQVHELLNPIVNCMKANQLGDIEARCLAIWSIYYVGFRNAVVNHFTAKECTESISCSIKVVLKK